MAKPHSIADTVAPQILREIRIRELQALVVEFPEEAAEAIVQHLVAVEHALDDASRLFDQVAMPDDAHDALKTRIDSLLIPYRRRT